MHKSLPCVPFVFFCRHYPGWQYADQRDIRRPRPHHWTLLKGQCGLLGDPRSHQPEVVPKQHWPSSGQGCKFGVCFLFLPTDFIFWVSVYLKSDHKHKNCYNIIAASIFCPQMNVNRVNLILCKGLLGAHLVMCITILCGQRQ